MARRKFDPSNCMVTLFIIIWCMGFFGGIFLGAGYFIFSSINDYTRITDLKYTAEIIDDALGTVRVTEQITYNIHCANDGRENLEWEIWRDLPEEQDYDGVKVLYNVLSVKRLKPDGTVDFVLAQAPRLLLEDDEWSVWEANRNTWYHSEGPYNEYEDRYECLLIYPGGVYREVQTYEIEYEMINGSLRYGDCSETYISIYSGSSIKWLESFSAEILVPTANMPQGGNYSFNTYGTNANKIPFSESATANAGYHTFSFSLNKSQLKFRPYNRFIEFSLVSFGSDKWAFTNNNKSFNRLYDTPVHSTIVADQAEYDRLPAKWATIKIVVLLASMGLAALIVYGEIRRDRKKQGKYNFYRPEIPYDKYREIPSPLDTTFAGALVMCKHKLSDDVPGGYAAAMLSLARKNYIVVDRKNPNGKWDDKNTKICVVPAAKPPVGAAAGDTAASATETTPPSAAADTREKLTPSEELYFELIRKHAGDNEITMQAFQNRVTDDYDNTAAFVTKTNEVVKRVGVSEAYFQKPNYKAPKKDEVVSILSLLVGAIIFMTATNLIVRLSRLDMAFGAFFVFGFSMIAAAVMRWVFSKKYVLLTQKGEDEYAKWRGLYNFLNDDSLMHEQTVDRIEMWEEYLVYATAFGIPEKVLKALEIKYPDIADSAIGRTSIVRHTYFRSAVFMRASTRSFRSSTRTATSTSRSRISGGYGGGGRGGGGGGGS